MREFQLHRAMKALRTRSKDELVECHQNWKRECRGNIKNPAQGVVQKRQWRQCNIDLHNRRAAVAMIHVMRYRKYIRMYFFVYFFRSFFYNVVHCVFCCRTDFCFQVVMVSFSAASGPFVGVMLLALVFPWGNGQVSSNIILHLLQVYVTKFYLFVL